MITVRNRGRLPIAWVLIEDMLPRGAIVSRPPRIEVKGHRLAVAMLGGHGRKTLNYQLHFAMRGYYQVGPMVLETGDLFGLHRRFRIVADPVYILVYPKVIPLPGYDIASRRPIGEIKLTHRLFEDPTRIAGVRAYQPGDPLNRVHWSATARTGVLHSKVYDASTIAGATILLDFHRDSYPARNEPGRSELAVTASVALANAVALMGQPVGLITNGRDAADRIRRRDEIARRHAGPQTNREATHRMAAMREDDDRLRPLIVPNGRGPEVFTRIRETLARVELSDGLTFDRLLIEAEPRLPRDATVIAVLAEVTPDDGRIRWADSGGRDSPSARCSWPSTRSSASTRPGRSSPRASPSARCPTRRSCTGSASSSSSHPFDFVGWVKPTEIKAWHPVGFTHPTGPIKTRRSRPRWPANDPVAPWSTTSSPRSSRR